MKNKKSQLDNLFNKNYCHFNYNKKVKLRNQFVVANVHT